MSKSRCTEHVERPILFSSQMVRAIIDGQKTQTRRLIKGVPADFIHYTPLEHFDGSIGAIFSSKPEITNGIEVGTIYCPYGKPGDKLWVRETWASYGSPARITSYRADRDTPLTGGKWSPSIHMPRWASRITLEIVGVRVERLQDIGKDGRKARDVLAEGITPELIANERKWFHADDSPAIAYSRLWESINGKGSWRANPWVWVVEFKPLNVPVTASQTAPAKRRRKAAAAK